ncbi:MAG: iron hydrogenase small subunit [Uliginosibacterium sp.]|jgi:ferredoxin hydrogenase gamma subunit|nr:iron hydrogenase small subunit [Uliginosibacterium sp.]
MKTYINGKELGFEPGETILSLARRHDMHIPTLCELHDIGHAPGTCRVCLVEVKRPGVKEPVFVTACDTPVAEHWQVLTDSPMVREKRRLQVELLMADHHQDCATCSRHGNCEVLDTADYVGLRSSRFLRGTDFPMPETDDKAAIQFDQTRCIRCLRCVTMCREIQGVDALEISGRGFANGVRFHNGFRQEESACVACGQCVLVCPTGALGERDDTQKVIDYLADPAIKTVFQIAPAIRVGFGEEFGVLPGTNIEGQVVSALRRIGADVVLDTNFAADLVIMEEGTEVLGKLKNREGVTFTSCCPGWINFAEKHYPEILPRLSTTRSPQQCLGSLAKSYLAEKMHVDRKQIRVISIMPCTAKKEEAARPDFTKDGLADVDIVLTLREFARLLKRQAVDLKSLEPSAFDNPLMTEYTGSAVIFGTTGGVMEAALRTVYFVVNGKELEQVEIGAVRGKENIRTASIDVGGDVGTVRIAVAHGLKAARELTESVLAGKAEYDFVEVMACPGGCADGGGTLRHKKRYKKHSAERSKGLYQIDKSRKLRQSHHNEQVQKLYAEYLGEPNSELAHDLLHTHYHNRRNEALASIKKIWDVLKA